MGCMLCVTGANEAVAYFVMLVSQLKTPEPIRAHQSPSDGLWCLNNQEASITKYSDIDGWVVQRAALTARRADIGLAPGLRGGTNSFEGFTNIWCTVELSPTTLLLHCHLTQQPQAPGISLLPWYCCGSGEQVVHSQSVLQISSRSHESIRRVYLLSYIPSGFWSHLISRIYRDQTISVITEFLFDMPPAYADLLKVSAERDSQRSLNQCTFNTFTNT